MPSRRILSLWFPRLGAERLLRQSRGRLAAPLAVAEDVVQMQVISALSAEAEAAGLRVGQPLRDAQAMCATLLTRPRNVHAEAAFLAGLRRWSGKFSPWTAEEPPDALVLDVTGCAHLFGGEEGLARQAAEDCAAMGLTVRAGIADTLGAAWALARFGGHDVQPARSGDAIEQEARATRSRAARRRHWERGGPAPAAAPRQGSAAALRIAPPGQTFAALAPLPVAALRLDPEIAAGLNRLGLRRVRDLAGQPRAGLARRFGKGMVYRMDQALGAAPEPVSPARHSLHFAVRMTLPDPIGLEEDMLAALSRLLPRLCASLEKQGHGARRVRLQAYRTDQSMQWIEVGLAAATAEPERIRPLLAMKLDSIDAGFGIDMLRLEAVQTEPVHSRVRTGHLQADGAARHKRDHEDGLADLMARIGARTGLDALTRRHPASSHIPEKRAQILAAAWSSPAPEWPAPAAPRPLLLWPPEPVTAPEEPTPPGRFRWRRRDLETVEAAGPERIAPEWWLDDPAWRSGVRDYWRITTASGDQLWLFYAHGGTMSAGWFCHGAFA